jgi:hypothetical protein
MALQVRVRYGEACSGSLLEAGRHEVLWVPCQSQKAPPDMPEVQAMVRYFGV